MLFRKQNNKKIGSLPKTKKTRSISPIEAKKASGKASAHASHPGSLTVECAFILPLFFLGMVTVIGFMNLYQMQTKQLLELCDKAKEAGVYAYVTEEQGKEITLPAVYSYESPVAVVPLPKIWMKNTVRVHCWTGYESSGLLSSEEEAEEMVYVTVHGGVYHTDTSCHHLDLSIHQVSGTRVSGLRNKNGEKYHPCEHCSQGTDSPGGLVYITDSGNRYHILPGCSGLKRTVRLVKRSDIARLPQCKNCASHK